MAGIKIGRDRSFGHAKAACPARAAVSEGSGTPRGASAQSDRRVQDGFQGRDDTHACRVSVAEVARRMATTRVTMRQWRGWFLLFGDLDGLKDLPRSGRPLKVRVILIKLACFRPDPKRTRFRDTWTR